MGFGMVELVIKDGRTILVFLEIYTSMDPCIQFFRKPIFTSYLRILAVHLYMNHLFEAVHS